MTAHLPHCPPLQTMQARFPTPNHEDGSADECRPRAAFMRAKPPTNTDTASMTDDELGAWIGHCGRQMLAAQKLLDGGCENYFEIHGERDRWWKEERAALRERARRPHLVKRMEAERGLA